MAEIMSDVLGKEIRFQQNTFEAYKDRFVSFGMSDAMAQGMTDMAWAKNEGIDNAVQRTPHNSTSHQLLHAFRSPMTGARRHPGQSTWDPRVRPGMNSTSTAG